MKFIRHVFFKWVFFSSLLILAACSAIILQPSTPQPEGFIKTVVYETWTALEAASTQVAKLTPEIPTATSTNIATALETTPLPTPIPLTEPPTVIFSMDSANQTPPEDVLEEIGYYGGAGGGGGVCMEASYPHIGDAPDSKEKMEEIGIYTCGWLLGENVAVTIQYPDGKTFKLVDTQETFCDDNQKQCTYFISYVVHLDEPAGLYIFIFEGESAIIQHTVTVEHPDGPRIRLLGDQLHLLNFQPGENIRLFIYDPAILLGWQLYQVDSYGRLTIALDLPEYLDSYLYVVVAELSGEIRDINNTRHHRGWGFSGQIQCPGGLPPRLETMRTDLSALVLKADGLVAYDQPGYSSTQKAFFPAGSEIFISEYPAECAGGTFWWEIRTTQSVWNWGIWMPESGQDGYYLEPISDHNIVQVNNVDPPTFYIQLQMMLQILAEDPLKWFHEPPSDVFQVLPFSSTNPQIIQEPQSNPAELSCLGEYSEARVVDF